MWTWIKAKFAGLVQLGYGSDRATWLVHSLLALFVALFSASFALGLYYGGEARQFGDDHFGKGIALRDIRWLDYLMDALCPLCVIGLYESAIRGQWLVFAVVLAITGTIVWQVIAKKLGRPAAPPPPVV